MQDAESSPKWRVFATNKRGLNWRCMFVLDIFVGGLMENWNDNMLASSRALYGTILESFEIVKGLD